MPAKELIVQKKVQKHLLRLPLNIHERLVRALSLIQMNPIIGTKLHGELRDTYKFRVGDYRIVYKLNKQNSIVEVVKIEHRQGVYK